MNGGYHWAIRTMSRLLQERRGARLRTIESSSGQKGQVLPTKNKGLMLCLALAATAVLCFAQTPSPGTRGGTAGQERPVVNASVRLEDWARMRTVSAGLLDWPVGVQSGSFPRLTFSEAAANVDALNVANVVGSSAQELSWAIPKRLDERLAPGEIIAVRDRLRALRLQMRAYATPAMGASEAAQRKLFEFVRTLGVRTIISSPAPAQLAAVDKLAEEFGIDVAVNRPGAGPDQVLRELAGRSRRIGVYVDTGIWMDQRIDPLAAVGKLKDRLLVLNLPERSSPSLPDVLNQMQRLGIKPSLITVDAAVQSDSLASFSRAFEIFERALRPIMAERVNEMSQTTPMFRSDPVMSAAERERIESRVERDLTRYGFPTIGEARRQVEAAIPAQPTPRPQRPRKLLVLDVNIGYNGHVAGRYVVNYGLEMLGKKTGAFEAVFSNDLDNLKYPRIQQYDAVFLNNTVGMIFVDPEVRDGLLRFVRQGGGLAGNHGASHASMDWPEFGEMLGAVRGIHRANDEQAMVAIDDPESPLTASFHGKSFLYRDEFYRFPNPPYSRERMHVLLRMDVAQTDMNQGQQCGRPCARPDADYALSWIRRHGQGRVYYTVLGHQPALMTTPALVQHMLSAVRFVLGDLEADASPATVVKH